MAEQSAETLVQVYHRLHQAYGPQGWWPGNEAFEVAVGAILTQNTAWANVEKALNNLKAAGALSPAGIMALPLEELQCLIRPSGYYNAKARKLKALVEMLSSDYSGDPSSLWAEPLPRLRQRLLSTHGIGEETADSIILYAANKPIFVIDAYTRRIFSRLGLRPHGDGYDHWQRLFSDALPADAGLFNEYHALIVRHGKNICRKEPLCHLCPLMDICAYGRPGAAFT
ncbi:MAG: endonuclease III domain-containing protein [Dehalococcoidia bacterium]